MGSAAALVLLLALEPDGILVAVLISLDDGLSVGVVFVDVLSVVVWEPGVPDVLLGPGIPLAMLLVFAPLLADAPGSVFVTPLVVPVLVSTEGEAVPLAVVSPPVAPGGDCVLLTVWLLPSDSVVTIADEDPPGSEGVAVSLGPPVVAPPSGDVVASISCPSPLGLEIALGPVDPGSDGLTTVDSPDGLLEPSGETV